MDHPLALNELLTRITVYSNYFANNFQLQSGVYFSYHVFISLLEYIKILCTDIYFLQAAILELLTLKIKFALNQNEMSDACDIALVCLSKSEHQKNQPPQKIEQRIAVNSRSINYYTTNYCYISICCNTYYMASSSAANLL